MRKLIVLSFVTLDGVMQAPGSSFDLLLGRKTYEIFAAYWPYADTAKDPIAACLNKATLRLNVTFSIAPAHNNVFNIISSLCQSSFRIL